MKGFILYIEERREVILSDDDCSPLTALKLYAKKQGGSEVEVKDHAVTSTKGVIIWPSGFRSSVVIIKAKLNTV